MAIQIHSPSDQVIVKKPINILFSAAGRRVSLLRHFSQTLKHLGLEGQIIAADAGKTAPTAHVADLHVLVPRISEANYVDELLRICKEQSVSLLFPLIDTDLQILADNKRRFEEIGTTVVVSSPETIRICSNKNETYCFFKEHQIDTPDVIPQCKIENISQKDFPLLIKPFDGSSGIGVTKIKNSDELRFFFKHINNAMLQEYVDGTEFTIDVLVGFDGEIVCAIPRKRIEIRGGEVSKGVTLKSPSLMGAAIHVVRCLPGALGCITVQCFLQKDGRIRFIEINPRFGGGFPLSIHAGADYPRWIIEQYLNGQKLAYRDDWEDDLAMLRFDDEVIVKGSEIR